MGDRADVLVSRRKPWIRLFAVGCMASILGYITAYDPWVSIVICIGMLVGSLILARNLRVLIPLTTVSLVLGSSTLPESSLWFFAKFAMLGAIAATILPAMTSPREHLPVPARFVGGFAGLVGLMLLSTAWSVAPAVTITKAASMLLLGLAVAVAIPLGLRDHRDLARVIFWVGVVAAMTVLAGLVLSATGLVPWLDSVGRFRGILVNANTLGYFVAPILPAIVILASQSAPGRHRAGLIVAILVIAVGLALTGSRAGAVAAVAGVTTALFASRLTGQDRQARRALVVAMLGLVAAVVIFSSLNIRNESPGGEGFFEVGTGSLRAVVWADGLRLIAERPLLGYGFATTQTLIPAAQDVSQGTILGSLHNSYLEAGLDLGWVGTIWLFLLALSGLIAAWRVARSPGPLRWIGTVTLAGIVGGMVNGIFESGLLAAGGLVALPFWLMVAMAHSIQLEQRAVERGNARC